VVRGQLEEIADAEELTHVFFVALHGGKVAALGGLLARVPGGQVALLLLV
jgi:hypothetical protein